MTDDVERFRHAYVHGFASGPLSRKGLYLREKLSRHGVDCALPDLNAPSFSTSTYRTMLAALDRMDAEGPSGSWRLIGSSMGGYLAARWAQLCPERVERLALLCPGFDMVSRWPGLIGEAAMARWEATGGHEVEDGAGVPRRLHWEFVAEARRHPAYPEVDCPVLILHGTRDEVVPIEVSRRYAASRSHVRLVELDAEHSLLEMQETLAREIVAFFGLSNRRL